MRNIKIRKNDRSVKISQSFLEKNHRGPPQPPQRGLRSSTYFLKNNTIHYTLYSWPPSPIFFLKKIIENSLNCQKFLFLYILLVPEGPDNTIIKQFLQQNHKILLIFLKKDHIIYYDRKRNLFRMNGAFGKPFTIKNKNKKEIIMSKKVENNENIEETIPAVIPDEGTYLADIVKKDDGFHVQDLEGNDLGVCKLVDEGKTLALPKNASNRQWYNLAKAEEAIAAEGKVQLLYKASKTFGSRGTTIPDAKLIAYLSEDEQAEYKAIIERAREKMMADKAKPVSELDKLYAKLKKTEEQIEAYKAANTTGDNTDAE